MPSKLVTDREKSTNAVIAAARTHGAVAADAVAQALAGVLEKGEKQPDVGLLLELCTRALDRSIAQVVSTDAANEAELADAADDVWRAEAVGGAPIAFAPGAEAISRAGAAGNWLRSGCGCWIRARRHGRGG